MLFVVLAFVAAVLFVGAHQGPSSGDAFKRPPYKVDTGADCPNDTAHRGADVYRTPEPKE